MIKIAIQNWLHISAKRLFEHAPKRLEHTNTFERISAAAAAGSHLHTSSNV